MESLNSHSGSCKSISNSLWSKLSFLIGVSNKKAYLACVASYGWLLSMKVSMHT